jgi:MFS family permease
MSSYLRVLRHPDFRFLFFGQSASAVGDQVVVVALALYITQRTGSATDLGLVLAAQTLPLVGLLLFGGVWADRLPRARIMIAADGARAALHGVGAPLVAVIGCAVLTGFGWSLMGIFWETLLARHIPTGALSRVSSYDWMGSLALLPVGFVIAGPLASAFGARTVLGVGSVLGLAMLGLALVPRSTRELGYGPSAHQLIDDVKVEPGG